MLMHLTTRRFNLITYTQDTAASSELCRFSVVVGIFYFLTIEIINNPNESDDGNLGNHLPTVLSCPHEVIIFSFVVVRCL